MSHWEARFFYKLNDDAPAMTPALAEERVDTYLTWAGDCAIDRPDAIGVKFRNASSMPTTRGLAGAEVK